MEFRAATDTEINQGIQARNRPRSRKTKLFKAGPESPTTVALSPHHWEVSAASGYDEADTVGIGCMAGIGTVMKGPVGFSANPSQIRIAGMWKLNDVLLGAAPSTILTPIPVLRFALPLEAIQGFVEAIAVTGTLGVALS